jgi:hypothetical protein
MSSLVTIAGRGDFGARSAAVVTALSVFLFADFAITMTSQVHARSRQVESERFHHSEVFKKHDGVSLVGQPRTHVLALRKHSGLRDGLVARADQVLVSVGSGAQDVDERPVSRLLSDDKVTVSRSRSCNHKISFPVIETKTRRPLR